MYKRQFQASYSGADDSEPALAQRALTTRALDQLRKDASNDSLPEVSYIIATAQGSEHPGPSSPAQGAAYIADVLDALTANPEVWAKTALFIMFDENDGFFDHMPPPAPPSKERDGTYAGHSQVSTEGEYHLHFSQADKDLEREDLMGNPYGLGPRVPAYVISPWSRGGFVCSEVMDHTSVIRFLEQRFGVREPNISTWRRAVCGDFTSAFDFETPNKSTLPTMPDPRSEARLAAALPERTVPIMPKEFTIPVQEKGFRPQRPNQYRPAVSLGEQDSNLRLTFMNEGSKAIVFHLYDRYNLDAVPKRYTIDQHQQFTDTIAASDERIDVQVMGPEGFHRRIKMKKQHWALFSQLVFDVTAEDCAVTAKVDGMTLTLNHTQPSAQSLPRDMKVTVPVDSNGRYDVTVFLGGNKTSYIQMAGRLPA